MNTITISAPRSLRLKPRISYVSQQLQQEWPEIMDRAIERNNGVYAGVHSARLVECIKTDTGWQYTYEKILIIPQNDKRPYKIRVAPEGEKLADFCKRLHIGVQKYYRWQGEGMSRQDMERQVCQKNQ